jgi:hypothetical protein
MKVMTEEVTLMALAKQAKRNHDELFQVTCRPCSQ